MMLCISRMYVKNCFGNWPVSEMILFGTEKNTLLPPIKVNFCTIELGSN